MILFTRDRSLEAPHALNAGALLKNTQAAIIGDDFPIITKGMVRVPRSRDFSMILPSIERGERFIAHIGQIVDAVSKDGKDCQNHRSDTHSAIDFRQGI